MSHVDYPCLGVEMEMPVAHRQTGHTCRVHSFFRNLGRILEARNQESAVLSAKNQEYGLQSSYGIHSLDNSYNNLESSLGPTSPGPDGLSRLGRLILQELQDVDHALKAEQGMVINFSEHPDTRITRDMYFRYRAPKAIYDYSVNYRGWNHAVGFDAKAHNSPSTSLPLEDCIPGMNCLLGLSAVFIAIFANSPFEQGRITGFKENRLTIWERLMDCSRFPGDHKLHRPPQVPFRNLAHYFQWMFGPGTSMWFAGCSKRGKSPDKMYLIPGDPPLLDYLGRGRQQAVSFPDRQAREVIPDLKDLEYHQFTQYTDCRLRYTLRPEYPDPGKFLDILKHHPHKLEELLDPYLTGTYLEGRAAGANFPDRAVWNLNQPGIAESMAIAPSAIQTGLLRNLNKTRSLVEAYNWDHLTGLRMEAARHGLDGEYAGLKVRDLCGRVLETAGQGLRSQDHWMLNYPLWVLKAGITGSDRALARFEQLVGSHNQRLRQLILERKMIPPA